MTDYFALLGQPRRPCLERDALKQRFLLLSAGTHPDKTAAGGKADREAAAQAFTEFNAAYQCLAEPKTRLLHLLELETGNKPKGIQEIPAALADQFAEVATACRLADSFLAEKSKTTSPLLQAQLFERGQEWVEQLNTLQQKLNGLSSQLSERLERLDRQWNAANAEARRPLLPHLEELYRLFSYSNRWHRQIQERVVQLSL